MSHLSLEHLHHPPMAHRINSKPLHVAWKVGPWIVPESPGVGALSWFSITPSFLGCVLGRWSTIWLVCLGPYVGWHLQSLWPMPCRSPLLLLTQGTWTSVSSIRQAPSSREVFAQTIPSAGKSVPSKPPPLLDSKSFSNLCTIVLSPLP